MPEDPAAAFATWRTPDHRAYSALLSGEENAIVVAKFIKSLHGSIVVVVRIIRSVIFQF